MHTYNLLLRHNIYDHFHFYAPFSQSSVIMLTHIIYSIRTHNTYDLACMINIPLHITHIAYIFQHTNTISCQYMQSPLFRNHVHPHMLMHGKQCLNINSTIFHLKTHHK